MANERSENCNLSLQTRLLTQPLHGLASPFPDHKFLSVLRQTHRVLPRRERNNGCPSEHFFSLRIGRHLLQTDRAKKQTGGERKVVKFNALHSVVVRPLFAPCGPCSWCRQGKHKPHWQCRIGPNDNSTGQNSLICACDHRNCSESPPPQNVYPVKGHRASQESLSFQTAFGLRTHDFYLRRFSLLLHEDCCQLTGNIRQHTSLTRRPRLRNDEHFNCAPQNFATNTTLARQPGLQAKLKSFTCFTRMNSNVSLVCTPERWLPFLFLMRWHLAAQKSNAKMNHSSSIRTSSSPTVSPSLQFIFLTFEMNRGSSATSAERKWVVTEGVSAHSGSGHPELEPNSTIFRTQKPHLQQHTSAHSYECQLPERMIWKSRSLHQTTAEFRWRPQKKKHSCERTSN